MRDDPPLEPQALDESDGLVSTCALAIAETGTIVLDGTAGMGRRILSLVPDYHLCVVCAEQIVGSVPDAIARLTRSDHSRSFQAHRQPSTLSQAGFDGDCDLRVDD